MNHKEMFLKSSVIQTPLGEMIAVGDEKALYLLEFADSKDLDYEIEDIGKRTRSAIIPGITITTLFIKNELEQYFKGNLQNFKTPIAFTGTPFQVSVWEVLRTIPFGQTTSYGAMAEILNKPTAFRAVANANGANKMAIIVPCHRVIKKNGDLCGYNGGVHRKQKLLDLERIGNQLNI